MTNYNDGKWHGWDGGECPVHPESEVECRLREAGMGTDGKIRKASHWAWGRYSFDPSADIIAFRVTKEHKEPRMFWAVGKHLHDTLDDAEAFCDALARDHPGKGYGDKSRIVKLIEVQE